MSAAHPIGQGQVRSIRSNHHRHPRRVRDLQRPGIQAIAEHRPPIPAGIHDSLAEQISLGHRAIQRLAALSAVRPVGCSVCIGQKHPGRLVLLAKQDLSRGSKAAAAIELEGRTLPPGRQIRDVAICQGIDDVSAIEIERLTGIFKRTRIDLVGRNVGNGSVVRALQQIEPASGDGAVQVDGRGSISSDQQPAAQVNVSIAVVVQFDPLVIVTGQGARPGDLIDYDAG